MKLWEVSNAPYNWTPVNDQQALNPNEYVISYVFNTDSGRKYRVNFIVAKSVKFGLYASVEFELATTPRRRFGKKSANTQGSEQIDTGITGTGDQYRILSTVVAIVREFVDKYDPILLYFTAREPSRIKLYQRFVANTARFLPNYRLKDTTMDGSGYLIFKLRRKQS